MRIRILVVDDEEPVLRACSRALGEIPDAEVVQEKLSVQAAALLTSEPFDLLISDLRMPEMNGVELLKVAHHHQPELPVILITGFPSPETFNESLRLGVAAYLMKPIVPDELVRAVKSVLKGHSTPRPGEGNGSKPKPFFPPKRG